MTYKRLLGNLIHASIVVYAFAVPFTLTYAVESKIYSFLYTISGIGEVAVAAENIPHAERAKNQTQKIKIAKKQPLAAERAILMQKVSTQGDVVAILEKIAECESGNNPLARNKTSSAKGLLQIIDGTWKAFDCSGDVLSREDNWNCGVKIATQSGLHHWDESYFCWNR